MVMNDNCQSKSNITQNSILDFFNDNFKNDLDSILESETLFNDKIEKITQQLDELSKNGEQQ